MNLLLFYIVSPVLGIQDVLIHTDDAQAHVGASIPHAVKFRPMTWFLSPPGAGRCAFAPGPPVDRANVGT